MFYKLGLKHLFKQKSRLSIGIVMIAIGVALLFTYNITVDTVDSTMKAHLDYIYGNIDYTVYRNDGLYDINASYSIPVRYLDKIRQNDGVKSAAARVCNYAWYSPSDDETNKMMSFIIGINETDPQERSIGTGIVIDCDPSLGSPENVSIEDLLNTTIFSSPIVVSEELSRSNGFGIGDKLRVGALNFTTAYATQDELKSVANGSTKQSELETSIFEDGNRWHEFTVTGIFLDGSESFERPIPHKENSLQTITPFDSCLYVPMSLGFKYIFNNKTNEVYYFLIDADSDFNSTKLLDSINNNTDKLPFSIFDVRTFVYAYVENSMMIARVLFTTLSAFGICICACLVNWLVQMRIEEQYTEIAILKSLGFSDRHVNEQFISQIFFMAVTGTLIGMVCGLIVPMNFDLDSVIQFLSYVKTYTVTVKGEVSISWQSVIVALLGGILSTVCFGIYPLFGIKKKTIYQMLYPIQSTLETVDVRKGKGKKGKEKIVIRRKKLKKYSAKSAALSIVLCIISVIFMYISVQNMFPDRRLNFTYGIQYFWLFMMVVFIIMFIASIMVLSSSGLGGFASILTRPFKRYFRGLDVVVYRSIHVRVNKIRVLIGILVVCLSLLTFVNVLFQSTSEGNTRRNRTNLGGDISIYYPLVKTSETSSIEAIDGIDKASIISYFAMQGWDFNSNDIMSYIVNKVDDIGGKRKNVTECVNVLVIDPEKYLEVNGKEKSIFSFESNDIFEDGPSFIRRLNSPNTIIIQKSLADDLGKRAGSNISVNINGFDANLKIIGVATTLPGAPFMEVMDAPEWYSRTIILSRKTLEDIAVRFLGNVDIMIKNKTISDFETNNQTIPQDLRGYLGGRMNRSIVDQVLSNISSIKASSQRFSTFVPTIPKIQSVFDKSRIVYAADNTTIQNITTINFTNRFYVFDPVSEWNFSTNEKIISSLDWINNNDLVGIDGKRVYNKSVNEIMYGIDNFINRYPPSDANRKLIFGNNCFCIVNEYTAIYDDIDTIDFIYRNKIGDILNVSFKDGENFYNMNFQIAALVDNHISYYNNDTTERSGYSISKKTFNYNSLANLSEVGTIFTDVFDMDANVFFTTYRELDYMQYKLTSIPLNFQSGSLMNHVYLDVRDNESIDSVVESINSGFSGLGVKNISVVNYRGNFTEKISDMGSVVVKIDDGANITLVLQKLREWYISRGLSWRENNVGTPDKMLIGSDINIAAPISNIITLILSMSIICSIFALSLAMYTMIRARNREFGIIKSQGFEEKLIGRVATVETLVVSLIGVILGVFSGIVISSIIFSAITTSLIIPVYLSIPWLQIISTSIMMISVAFISSIVVSSNVTKLTISENIRHIE